MSRNGFRAGRSSCGSKLGVRRPDSGPSSRSASCPVACASGAMRARSAAPSRRVRRRLCRVARRAAAQFLRARTLRASHPSSPRTCGPACVEGPPAHRWPVQPQRGCGGHPRAHGDRRHRRGRPNPAKGADLRFTGAASRSLRRPSRFPSRFNHVSFQVYRRRSVNVTAGSEGSDQPKERPAFGWSTGDSPSSRVRPIRQTRQRREA